jgi:hypothetical protein
VFCRADIGDFGGWLCPCVRRRSCVFAYEKVESVEPQNPALATSAPAPPFFKESEPSQTRPPTMLKSGDRHTMKITPKG